MRALRPRHSSTRGTWPRWNSSPRSRRCRISRTAIVGMVLADGAFQQSIVGAPRLYLAVYAQARSPADAKRVALHHPRTLARVLMGLRDRERGVTLSCVRCGRIVLLPWSGTDRAEIRIDGKDFEGWTAPPLHCPTCSELAKAG